MFGWLQRTLRGWLTRSLENPATPLDDDGEGDDFFAGGGRSASGVKITRKTALTDSAVWRAVNLISRDVAKLPLNVYRRQGEGKLRDTSHPAARLVRYKPNPQTTAYIFRQTLSAHALLQGNGYAYIVRDGDARPIELWPLCPDDVKPRRVNGALWYVCDVPGERQPSRVRAEDMLHIKGLGYDGLQGYPVLQIAKEALGSNLAAKRFGARFFRNNAQPATVIETPNSMKEGAQREFLRQWDAMHQGIDNAHRTAILTNGAKLNPFSFNARNAQLIESMTWGLREVANIFGVPAHKVGHDGRTAYASLEQENQSYLDESLDPWLVAWEQEMWDKLLTEEQKAADTHVIEFMRQALIRMDAATRAGFYTSMLSNGTLNRDEVRGMENKNPIPDGAGAAYFVPLNMREADKPAPLGIATIDDLTTILDQVAQGKLTTEAAAVVLQNAYPHLPADDITKILAGVEVSPPEPPPAPPANPAEPPGGDGQGPAPTDPPSPPAGKDAGSRARLRRTRRDPASAKSPGSAETRTPARPAGPAVAAAAAVAVDVGRRMIRRLRHQAVRAANSAPRLTIWLDDLPAQRTLIAEALRSPLAACAAARGSAPGDPGEAAGEAADRLLAEVRSAIAHLAAPPDRAGVDHVLELLEQRYDPMQPRGPDGKFGEGGTVAMRPLSEPSANDLVAQMHTAGALANARQDAKDPRTAERVQTVRDRLARDDAHLESIRQRVANIPDRVQQETAPRQKELDKMQKQALRLEQKANDQYVQGDPKLTKTEAKLEATLSAHSRGERELAELRGRLRQEYVARELGAPNPTSAPLRTGDLAENLTREHDRASAWMQSVMSSDHDDNLRQSNCQQLGANEKQRAHCTIGDGAPEIRLSAHDDAATVVHEYGHAIDRGDVLELSKGYLHHRTEGEAPEHMGKGYDPDEVGREDGWKEAFHSKARYVGKHYATGTEIVSMGAEKLYEHPIAFAKQDPEHFKFTVGILHGTLLKK